MIDIPLKYEISFFCDMSEVRPSSSVFAGLLTEFQDKGFLPVSFQELPSPEARVGLATSGGQWEIMIHRQRIVIVKRPIERDKTTMGTVADFFTEAIDTLTRMFRHVPPRKAHRLALVTEELMPAMTDAELRRTYGKLVNPLPFYTKNSPSEWIVRSVGRMDAEVNGVVERLNAISTVSRVQGQLSDPKGSTQFDRIRVDLDINTYQGSADTRFTPENTAGFFNEAIVVRNRLLSELEEHIK